MAKGKRVGYDEAMNEGVKEEMKEIMSEDVKEEVKNVVGFTKDEKNDCQVAQKNILTFVMFVHTFR